MTTNQGRAAEVIASAGAICGSDCTRTPADPITDCPRCVWCIGAYAQALVDAGLLTPDLPEPEMDIDRLIWRVDEEGFVYRKPDGRISTVGVGNPYPSVEIARRHALAILAAANHYATQEKK